MRHYRNPPLSRSTRRWLGDYAREKERKEAERLARIEKKRKLAEAMAEEVEEESITEEEGHDADAD